MSDFQTSTQFTQPDFVAGELDRNVPFTAKALTLTTATESNIFGYACFTTDNVNMTVGNPSAGMFAGILSHSKEILGGTVEGGAVNLAGQYTQATAIDTGAVKVPVSGNVSLGNYLQAANATGAITAFTGNVSANCTQINNAIVERVIGDVGGNLTGVVARIIGK